MAHTLTLEDVRQKLKLVKAGDVGKNTPVTKAYSSTRVTALEDGFYLNRPDGGTIHYSEMSLLLVCRLDSDPDDWFVDVFVYGQAAPFRLSQNIINYRQFLPEISQRSKDNFFRFVLLLIERSDSIYIDENTLKFLKTTTPVSYPDFKLFEEYTRHIWGQLLHWMKFQCDSCGEVYWVDDAKVSPDGAKTKCIKCQHVITVTRRAQPQPLHVEQKNRKTVPCPHCQYENRAGVQFCVMCQEALVDFTSKANVQSPVSAPKSGSGKSDASDNEQPTEHGRHSSGKDRADMALVSDLPLQAQGKRIPTLSLGELDTALQNELNSVEQIFSWYSKFATFMKVLGFLFAAGGVLLAFYIYFAMAGPPPPNILMPEDRLNYSIIAVISGILASLISLVVGNIISLNLQIERNTKLTALLLQRLISKST
ncbi:hypothetical protein CSB45_01990 [candidate division KSB3 bacterium]|uniref:Zinc finger/thioredoxin putative domain-containing protein n=1 Tax=candidate division KSB3 bacterium TaxID=2044937 RepID=A0A2G6E9N4_9BACT|nr:MAG: hypothetical protein CSB45_01990 [candidate division KSB3 bacterium]PIE30854.1 MAG: hypothetical protein CSA57_00600 [candidate division KSB3 bacterium]